MAKSPQERYQALKAYAAYSGLGIQLAVSLAVPMVGGWWLDTRFGTEPAWLLTGIFLGLCSIFVMLFKLVKHSNRKR